MPTFIHGKDTAVYIDEFDLSSYFTSADTSINNSIAETTAYGATDASFIMGMRSGTLSLSGMWAGDTDGSDEELQALLGNATTPVITVREGSASIGSGAIVAQANETSYAISSPVADVSTVTADFECSTNNTTNLTFALASGVQLTAGASIAHGSLGNLSSVDNSASSASGGAGTLHVPTNTISGGVTTIKIQHSANNSTWADLITFTNVSASTKTSEIKAVSGTVNRYLRATASTAGSSGSITFMIAFARF
tara:strand:+ start:6365 stop:7120 length:756 start_codon:yes stop_codon:yes gene_type:complete